MPSYPWRDNSRTLRAVCEQLTSPSGKNPDCVRDRKPRRSRQPSISDKYTLLPPDLYSRYLPEEMFTRFKTFGFGDPIMVNGVSHGLFNQQPINTSDAHVNL